MTNMEWNKLTDLNDLENIKAESKSHPVFIFKHSTRCAISSMAIGRLERSWNTEEASGIKAYYLDLISHREMSNKIAEDFGVYHQSPQVLVIKDGKCIYNDSHMGINYKDLLQVMKN